MARKITNNGAAANSQLTIDAAITAALTAAASTSTAYPETIAGQTGRIADAHEIIQRKAIAMLLKFPKGLGDTINSTASTTLAQSHKIMDTAAAINSIVVNPNISSQEQALGSKTIATVTIPLGYYTEQNSIDVEIANAPAGKTAISGEHVVGADSITVTGIKITSSGYITDTANETRTISLKATEKLGTGSNKNITLGSTNGTTKYLKITPVLGFYTADSSWETDVKYQPLSGTQLINVVESTNSGETLVESLTIPAGYYPNSVTVQPKINNVTTNKVINVKNDVGTLTSKSGNLTPVTNYDYFTKDAAYKIQEGSITAISPSGPTATNSKITFSGGITSPGWVSDNVTVPAIELTTVTNPVTSASVLYTADKGTTYTPEIVITAGADPLYIPAERWTGKGIKINPASSSTEATFYLGAKSSSYTNGVTISGGKAVIKVNLPGYKNSDDIQATLPVTTTIPTLGSNGASTPKLTITPAAGYYANTALQTSVNYFAAGAKTANVAVTLTPSGDKITASGTYTIPAGYYAGASTITFTGSNTVSSGSHTFTRNYEKSTGDSIESDKITTKYVKDVVTAGYIKDTSTKIWEVRDYQAGSLTMTTSTGVGTIACTTPGWVGGDIKFTLTQTKGAAEITPGDSTQTAISQGYYATGNITVKAVSTETKTHTYDVDGGDSNIANDSNAIVSVSRSTGKYMTSVTLDMSDLLTALCAI